LCLSLKLRLVPLSVFENGVPPSVEEDDREALFGFWSTNTFAYSCFLAYVATLWITRYKPPGANKEDFLSMRAKLLRRTVSQRFSTWHTIYAQFWEELEEDQIERKYTDLTVAATLELLSFLIMLVQDGQKVSLFGGDGYTAFRTAVNKVHMTVVKDLLDNGVSINTASEDGNTFLRYAADVGQEEVMQLLVDWGPDIDPINNKGRTPLHLACTFGRDDIAELLLKSHANIQATNVDGSTPLHMATHSNANTYDVLLAEGADPTIREYNGPMTFDLLGHLTGHVIWSGNRTLGAR